MVKDPDSVLKRYNAILREEGEAEPKPQGAAEPKQRGLEAPEQRGLAEPKHLALKRSGELAERVKQAYKIMDSCELCERFCRVNRNQGQAGNCGVKGLRVNSAFAHIGEEFFFVPSWTVFFSGCNLHCVFCQNWQISQMHQGQDMGVEELAEIFEKANDCKNLNLVGGSPTPFLPWILDALNRMKQPLKKPVVWNSNFYMSLQSMELLSGLVDVYLSDWKYGNSKCAERLSKVPRYWEVVERNHRLAFKDAEVVVRHLVLPNHFECCTRPILERIAELFKDKVVVNVMAQYRPEYRASEYEEINRRLKPEEFAKAIALAEKLGLNYIQ